MAITTHVYTAKVGTTNLSVRRGKLSLDSTRAPHVQGDGIEIAMPGSWSTVSGKPVWTPNAATLDALDPRTSPAPRVIVTCSAGIPRTFNLHVRGRSIDHRAGTVTLSLASDEGLLQDYAPLSDNPTPRAYEASLRGVINYVLGVVLPGTTLATSPSTDADVTAYWSLTNELPNPGGEVDTAGWSASVNCTIFSQTAGAFAGSKAIGITANAAGPLAFLAMDPARRQAVRPGELKTFRLAFKSNYASGRTAQLSLRWYNSQGNAFGADTLGPVHTPTTTGWTDGLYVTGTAPEGAASVLLIVTITGSTAAGQGYYVDSAALYTGDFRGYFDGNTTGPNYVYAWTNGAHVSTSTRKAIIERPPEALTWKAGQSALDFLRPLIQSKGFRLVCDEKRKWTLRNEAYAADGALALRTGVNLITADESISRNSGYWFDARTTRYRWTDAAGVQQERVDSYALTTPHTRLTLLEIDAVYPGPGRSEYAVRRAQGIGREVTVSTVSDWTAAAEQNVSVTLPDTPVQIGLTQSVTYDLGTDEMTVTTRATDTPAGAINLLTGTVNTLTGTINSLT